ncbi:MAG: hypothetical protein ACR2O3_12445 [Rhizobiaceae bacterium]
MIEEKPEASVWYIAGVAICIVVGLMFVTGLFNSADVVAIAAQ